MYNQTIFDEQALKNNPLPEKIWSFHYNRTVRVKALKRYMQRYNRPIDSKVSELIWRWSVQATTPINTVYPVFKYLGFKPYSGFPLVRN